MAGSAVESPSTRPSLDGNHSKVIRRRSAGRWQDVPVEPYKVTTETWRGVTRRELIGKRGESPRFHVRYFELEPGGVAAQGLHGIGAHDPASLRTQTQR